MRQSARLALALTAGVLLSAPAQAQGNPAARFVARPPASFTVTPSSHPAHDKAFVINSRSGSPKASNVDGVLCKAAFKASPANSQLTQAQINTMIVAPAWRENARATLGRVFALSADATFSQAGASGLEFMGTPRAGPDAAKSRVYLSMVETPAGRTTLTCATFVAEFTAALPVFRVIRNALTMP